MDGLAIYLRAAGERPLLSPIEERSLARKSQAGCQRAKDELVERNLRLVIPTAKTFRGQGLAFEDLIQEGNVGLIKAAERFDPERGYRFSTYATWWIHQSVSRAVACKGATIRIPVHVGEDRYRIYRASKDFEAEHGREPSASELVELTGLSTEAIHWARSVPEIRTSLDAPVGSDQDRVALGSVMPDDAQSEEVAGEVLSALSRAKIRRVLSSLPEQERYVVERHYGLEGGSPVTLRELGSELSVRYQYVSVINRRALKRLFALLCEQDPGEQVA